MLVAAGFKGPLSSGAFLQMARCALTGFIAGFLLLVVSGQLKTMAGELVAIWIVDGYLLGHSMVLRRRKKLVFLFAAYVGVLLGNLAGDETLYVASSFTFAGVVETCAAALMLSGVKSAKQLMQPSVFIRFLPAGCVIAPVLSGVVAVVLLQGIFTSHPFSSFSNWVISDSLGFLIFTPVTLVLLSGEWRTLLEPRNRARSAALLALTGIVATVVFLHSSYIGLYWMLPPLALLAFHAELSTVLVGTLLFICVSVPLTIHGTGPLWLLPFETMQDRILALQLFFVAALSIVLPITVLQTQRNALRSALTEGQRRFRNLAERSEEVLMELSGEGAFQYVSPRAKAVLGYEAEMLWGTLLLGLVHQDDKSKLQELLRVARMTTEENSAQYRLRRADGTFIWVRSFAVAMPSATPGVRPALAFTVRDVDSHVVAENRRNADEKRLMDMAFVDGLTGLHNRRYLDRHIEKVLTSSLDMTDGRAVTVIFADIDYFKNFNDSYGHQTGDECLRGVGQCIRSTLRSSDVLARYGGEEFVCVLENCGREEAVQIAEFVRAAVESLMLGHQGSPFGLVTLSIGVAQGKVSTKVDLDGLFVSADSALYVAKRTGRNRVETAWNEPAPSFSHQYHDISLGAPNS
ncbi:diguanylate cyclase [Paraburkholderia strydomiana]|uniref:sensor domain-containing diguanylate cyclase n=1 Tax=Paraburkholderia strydomiana TaxID=1245417 RepID=UPI0038BCF2F0